MLDHTASQQANDERSRLLSDVQKTYLRRVGEGRTSKEIARELKTSHHTVNAQIAVAVRILGARSRRDAAQLFAEIDDRSYNRSCDPHLVAERPEHGRRSAPGNETASSTGFRLPIATQAHPVNRMTPIQRVGSIIALAVIGALAIGGLIAGVSAQLDGLADLV